MTCGRNTHKLGTVRKLWWCRILAADKEYTDVFALDSTEVGRTKLLKEVEHSIDTQAHTPIRQAPHSIPFSLCSKVEILIQKMLEQKIVEESSSPWASPIVLVSKPDGSTRICGDYRLLNAGTKVDKYPLPRVDECLDVLSGQKYFSTLDLATSNWQIKMAEESQEKTAFTTHNGFYEFTVMMFGLCNAPTAFQRLTSKVLKGLINQKCMVYLDDALIMGKTFTEHLNNL